MCDFRIECWGELYPCICLPGVAGVLSALSCKASPAVPICPFSQGFFGRSRHISHKLGPFLGLPTLTLPFSHWNKRLPNVIRMWGVMSLHSRHQYQSLLMRVLYCIDYERAWQNADRCRPKGVFCITVSVLILDDCWPFPIFCLIYKLPKGFILWYG